MLSEFLDLTGLWNLPSCELWAAKASSRRAKVFQDSMAERAGYAEDMVTYTLASDITVGCDQN
jgi:hypothetical protein